MQRAATKYDIPIGILYAVGLTETGHRDSLQPYAMNSTARLSSWHPQRLR